MTPLGNARLRVWATWLTLFTLVTAVLVRLSDRPDIRTSHGVLSYLLLIIGASRQGGRALSLLMTALGYLAVDYFFVPPRRALGVASELDWWILFGFLGSGLLISQLFYQQQRATREAEARAIEVERLSRERLQLEREASVANVLREADRIKNALINSIAHDLRSPVATLSLLTDPTAGFNPDIALRRVNEEASRLGQFIGTLQRFASESDGRAISAEARPVNLLVQTAMRSSAGILTSRDVRVTTAADDLLVVCDLTLSTQVLGNLLQNATRYAPASEPVDVRVNDLGLDVEVVVADRGPGLGTADIERVFTPMRRRSADDGDLQADDRMGMGLSIARTFARAQRGDVYYRERDGGGSEFVLRLPRARVDAPAAIT